MVIFEAAYCWDDGFVLDSLSFIRVRMANAHQEWWRLARDMHFETCVSTTRTLICPPVAATEQGVSKAATEMLSAFLAVLFRYNNKDRSKLCMALSIDCFKLMTLRVEY